MGIANDKNKGLVPSVCGLIDDITLVKNVTLHFGHAALEEEVMPHDLKLVIFQIIKEKVIKY